MITEMLGIAEGILRTCTTTTRLLDRIMDSGDRSQQEVLHRRLEASQHEVSRNFAQEGASEHQLVEQRLQKMSSDDDKMSEHWMADLIVLDKNPLDDIHNTNTIKFVMKNGNLFEGDTLSQLWPRQKSLDRMYWWDGEPVAAH